MTAQVCDQLINKFDEFELEGLRLYSVLISDPATTDKCSRYPFKSVADKNKMELSTACLNGFIAVYELTKNGELFLVEFRYLVLFEDVEPSKVNEQLEGDFWLSLRKDFYEDTVYVPFKNGKIVTDRNEGGESKSLSKTETSQEKSSNWISSLVKNWVNAIKVH